MIVAGKTTFQVIFMQSGEQWVEGTFDNIHDAEDCVDRLEEENENNTWANGILLEEVTQKGDVISSKYFDLS